MPATTDVKLSKLTYVILYVKDTEKTIPFYRDTLGVKVRMHEQGWAELETGEATLCLHSDPDHKPERAAAKSCACFTVEDIYGTFEALKAKGVKFEKEPHMVCETPDGKTGFSADFRDPDGNMLSIFGYVKK